MHAQNDTLFVFFCEHLNDTLFVKDPYIILSLIFIS